MAHSSLPIHGVQFHPESVLTPQGRIIIDNFLELAGVDHVSTSDRADYVPPEPADDFFQREVDVAGWPLPRT
jgi:hypothetical protein